MKQETIFADANKLHSIGKTHSFLAEENLKNFNK